MVDIFVIEGFEVVYKYMRLFFCLDIDVFGEKKEVMLLFFYFVYSVFV